MIPVVLFLPLLPAQAANPDQLLQRAITEQQSGDLDTAVRDYKQLLAVRPGDIEARANLGAALAHLGRLEEAIEQYQQALRRTPAASRQPVLLNLALAYYKKGDFQDALPNFEELHNAQPLDARIAVLLGDTLIKLGKISDAMAMLAPLEKANAENADLEYVLGLAMVRAGSLRDGAARLEKVGAATRSGDAYLLAGTALMQLNEFEQARKDLDDALEFAPNLPGVYTLAGMARDQAGDANAAEPAFRDALKRNPDDFQANLYLGAILYKRRDLTEAGSYLDHALRLNPHSPLARYQMAMWKSASGDNQGAADGLAELVKEDPNWLDPHVELASLFYKLHRPQDGERERQTVDRLTAEQQAKGPLRP